MNQNCLKDHNKNNFRLKAGKTTEINRQLVIKFWFVEENMELSCINKAVKVLDNKVWMKESNFSFGIECIFSLVLD